MDINIYLDPITGDIAAIRSDSWRAWDSTLGFAYNGLSRQR